MTGQAILAKETIAARDRKRHHDAVTFPEFLHVISNFFDHAHEFMAEHHVFRLRKKTVVNVQIRTADRSRCYAQNDILRIFDARILHIVHFHVPRTMKYKCLHALSKRSPKCAWFSLIRVNVSLARWHLKISRDAFPFDERRKRNQSAARNRETRRRFCGDGRGTSFSQQGRIEGGIYDIGTITGSHRQISEATLQGTIATVAGIGE
jgi:hypothetical protein